MLEGRVRCVSYETRSLIPHTAATSKETPTHPPTHRPTRPARRHPDVEFVSQSPDIMLEFDVATGEFDKPTVVPVFLYGRYNKLVRGIPQSRWPCATCRQGGTDETGDKMMLLEKDDEEAEVEDEVEVEGLNMAPAVGTKRKATEPAAARSTAGSMASAPSAPDTPPSAVCRACNGTGLQYPNSIQVRASRLRRSNTRKGPRQKNSFHSNLESNTFSYVTTTPSRN